MRNSAFILAAIAIAVSGPVQAQPLSPAQIVQRHVGSGGDLDAIMQDYADDAVVFQQGRAVQGKPAIRALFARMFPPRPAGAPPRAPAPNPNPPRIWEEGDVGFMTGQMGAISLTEQYLVRDGKIVLQAIYMGAPPTASAAP